MPFTTRQREHENPTNHHMSHMQGTKTGCKSCPGDSCPFKCHFLVHSADGTANKCDGQSPACARCIKSGKACAGYEHDLIFRPPVVLAGHQQATVANDNRPRTSSSSRPHNKRRRCNSPDVGTSPKQETARRRTTKVGAQLHNGAVPTALSWPLLDIISLVVQNFSPAEFLQDPGWDYSCSTPSAPRVCGGWVEALPMLASEEQADELLSPSIKTLAVSIISRGEYGRAPVSDALEAQSVALVSLRVGIQQRYSKSNLLAAASMCLFLAEMMLPTSNTTAEIHARGIGELLQLQDPETYSCGVSHQLFVGFRPVIVLNSFACLQHPFLAQTPWLEAPFSRSGVSPLQRLFSDVADTPRTLAIAGKLAEMGPPQRNELAGRHVIRDLTHSLCRLMELQQSHGDGSQSNFSFTGGLHDHHTAIHFSSITAANFFTHVWAFHIACARTVRQTISLLPHLDTELEATHECLISKQTTVELATLIFRSIEFLTRGEFKLFGAASTILPLRLAGEVLRDEGADNADLWDWYHKVSRISDTTGYHAIGQQILDGHHSARQTLT